MPKISSQHLDITDIPHLHITEAISLAVDILAGVLISIGPLEPGNQKDEDAQEKSIITSK